MMKAESDELPPDKGYLQRAPGALVGLFRSRASLEAELLLPLRRGRSAILGLTCIKSAYDYLNV